VILPQQYFEYFRRKSNLKNITESLTVWRADNGVGKVTQRRARLVGLLKWVTVLR